MQKRYKQLISNTGVFAASKMASKIIVFLLLPFYTNILTTTEYGTTEMVLTYANLLVPILSLSIQESVFRFGLDAESNKKSILSNAVLVTVILVAVAIVILPTIVCYLDLSGYVFLFTVLVCSMMFRQIFNLFLKANNKNVNFAIDSVIYSFTLAGSNILFLSLLGLRVNGYILALIIANIISIVYCVLTGKAYKYISVSSVDITLLKKMLLYSIPLILNQISWWISNSSDRILLGKLDSFSSVGIYSAAAKIPAIISNFISVFIQAWVITAVENFKSEEGKKLFKNVFQYFNIMLIIGTYAVLISNQLITHIMLGEEFRSAYRYMPTLMVSTFYLGYAYFWGVIYTAEKKNIQAMMSTLISAVVNIVLNCVFIPTWGIQGACVATCAAHALMAVYRMIDTRKIMKFDWDAKRVLLSNGLLILSAILMIFEIPYIEVILICMFIVQLMIYRDMVMRFVKTVIGRARK